MSAAELDPTSADAEVLTYCKALVYEHDKMNFGRSGYLGVDKLPHPSADGKNIDAWIAEHITESSDLEKLNKIKNVLGSKHSDPGLQFDSDEKKIYMAAHDRINKPREGGRPKTSKKRSATRRRRSSKRQSRKMNKRRR